jgi:hypothetical protein
MTNDHFHPVVRAARADDLDALVDLELEAFHDAYESPLSAHTMADVRRKFADRLELLGPWVRVLENPDVGIDGMSMAYPIKIGLAGLTELFDEGRDMEDSDVIRDLIDQEGTTIWGLNIAVTPRAALMSGMLFLGAGMRALRAAHGIQRSYFSSRLPGLARWAARQMPGLDPAELTRKQQHALATRYLRATVRHGSISRMADPLLALYVESGAIPVKLVSRWDSRPARGFIDLPSLGYGVLCERRFDRAQAQ